MSAEAETFECAWCKNTFTKEWTDEEAEAEAVDLWGGIPEEARVICDDCFLAEFGDPEATR